MGGDDTDPVEAADGEMDLYGISTWEKRSFLDRLSAGIYWITVRIGQAIVVLLALLILVTIGGLSVLTDPTIGLLTVVSASPRWRWRGISGGAM